MSQWTAFPHAGEFAHDTDNLKKNWARLHAGDGEPCPDDPSLLAAWALFHNGDFQSAAEAGLKAGGHGITVANKATCIYATYLETKESTRLELFMQTAQRAEAQSFDDPLNPNTWYLHAYALGRYSQGISVAKALAQGLGRKIKNSLEQTIQLQPRHADAHIALGAFHAEVIDKVGILIGGMTYGANKAVGLKLFQEALKLNPGSAIGMMEHANGLLMLEGDESAKEATRLYEMAAACLPVDAAERLAVALAAAELHS